MISVDIESKIECLMKCAMAGADVCNAAQYNPKDLQCNTGLIDGTVKPDLESTKYIYVLTNQL